MQVENRPWKQAADHAASIIACSYLTLKTLKVMDIESNKVCHQKYLEKVIYR